jgi:hypothetical protein
MKSKSALNRVAGDRAAPRALRVDPRKIVMRCSGSDVVTGGGCEIAATMLEG